MHHEDSNLQKQAPTLFGLHKKNIHRVPDDFFSGLELSINKNRSGKRLTVFRSLKLVARFSFFTIIVLLILLSAFQVLLTKKYVPVETIRSIYTMQDGDAL